MSRRVKRLFRPTGIIRTLPSLYGDGSIGAQRMKESVEQLERGEIPVIAIAFSQLPKTDVLYLYLVINGQINFRFNIVGFESGKDSALECWDGQYRTPNFWCLCAAPVSRPENPIACRGFQGFRYTEELW